MSIAVRYPFSFEPKAYHFTKYPLNPNPNNADEPTCGEGGSWSNQGFSDEQQVRVGNWGKDLGKNVCKTALARAIAI
jgi:hypothetical protein